MQLHVSVLCLSIQYANQGILWMLLLILVPCLIANILYLFYYFNISLFQSSLQTFSTRLHFLRHQWILTWKSCSGWENTHMHLWSTAAKQVNKGWVEGHDGMPHVNEVIIVLDNISVTGNNHNCQKFEINNEGCCVADNNSPKSLRENFFWDLLWWCIKQWWIG